MPSRSTTRSTTARRCSPQPRLRLASRYARKGPRFSPRSRIGSRIFFADHAGAGSRHAGRASANCLLGGTRMETARSNLLGFVSNALRRIRRLDRAAFGWTYRFLSPGTVFGDYQPQPLDLFSGSGAG